MLAAARHSAYSENRVGSYYRARYYDPSAGRFASEDPIRFRAGTNFYAYVQNQPVNSKDPTGYCPSWVPDWLCKWWNSPPKSSPPPAPKQPRPQVKPVNICDAGETALFSEAGPNPYFNGGGGEDAWSNFKSKFIDKCIAAQAPGKSTKTVCTQGAGVLGPFAYCMCCEECDSKK
jgi:RHS repeat-associated protein